VTAAGEYRTTACAAHGHPEFTLVFSRDVPVPGLEKMLLGYFESSVAQGTSFKAGQTVQLGWATLRLKEREDGTLGVLEPDVLHQFKWVEAVDQSLLETWRQKEVLDSLGLAAQANYPRQALQAVVCSQATTHHEFILGRTEPTGPTDSGWFVGCTDEAHDHQSADALTAMPLIEIAASLPPLAQFFALPVGADVLISGPGRIRAKVFLDGEERPAAPGSYLDALSRPD
jgi:hypothetical protein